MKVSAEQDPVDPTSGMIFARVIDTDGGLRTIDWDAARRWTPSGPGQTLWLHLDRTVSAVVARVGEEAVGGLGLSEATVEALTSSENRPRAFREGDTLVTILRGINFNPDAQPEDMVAMQLWCDGTRVVTLRRQSPTRPFTCCRSSRRSSCR